MYDYYRIADVSDGSTVPRRASYARWWQTLPAGPARRMDSVVRGRAPRVLSPEAAMTPVWRDDVALDFPSARPAAERMWQAFLAPERVRISRAVVITLARGTTARPARVPVQVDVQSLCVGCGGRGEAWGETCGVCAGQGAEPVARYVLLRVPAGVRHDARLRYRIDVPHAAAFDLDVRVVVT